MTAAPPDWYPDPSGSGGLRYWDGQQWTSHIAPGPHHSPYGSAAYGAPPTAAGVATTPDGAPLAGWWHRVGASLLDQLLLVVVTLPFSLGVQASLQGRMNGVFEGLQRRIDENDPHLMSWYFHQLFHVMQPMVWVYIGQAAVSFLLFTVCLHRWGASPGQLATGLRVRLRERPGNLAWGRAALRSLLYPVLGTLVVSLGLATGSLTLTIVLVMVLWVWSLLDPLWAAWDARKQTLHDKVVRTNVVRQR